MQHREARRQPVGLALSPRLLTRLARRPLWLVGGALDLLGVAANALALRAGAVATVQAVKSSTVAFVLLFGVGGRVTRLRRLDVVSVVVLSIGTAAFVVAAQPSGADAAVGPLRWVAAVAIVLAVVAAGLGVAKAASGRLHSIALGVATGAVWALTTVLLKHNAHAVTRERFAGLASWYPWALVAGGVIGTIVNQSAFQSGDLLWSFPAMSVVEPVLAVTLGRVVFGERLNVRSMAGWVAVAFGAATALVAVAYLGHHQADAELALTGADARST